MFTYPGLFYRIWKSFSDFSNNNNNNNILHLYGTMTLTKDI